MAEECDGCKDSILNKTPSIIPDPLCQNECSDDVQCADVLYDKCILLSQDYDCLELSAGDNFLTALTALNELCGDVGGQNNCKVKTNSTDTCCDYLENKFISSDESIEHETVTSGGCKKIDLKLGCPEWNDFLSNGAAEGSFLNNWRNYNLGYQIAQYSDVQGCTVKLRGTIIKDFGNFIGINGIEIIKLEAGFRPASIRSFDVTLRSYNSSTSYPANIRIKPTGEVILYGYSYTTPINGLFLLLYKHDHLA